MRATWTAWAGARLLPFPGETWTVAASLKKAAARVAKAGGGEVPAAPTVDEETARAAALRVHERYNEAGNIPKDTLGDDLVDLWVARAGVELALEAVIATAAMVRTPMDHMKAYPPRAYEIRRDGRPWGRMRQHLAAASPADRERALAVASQAWTDTWSYGDSELPFALAFLTCNQAWVDRVVECSEGGAPRYGQQCVLAAVTEPERASRLLRIAADHPMRFQVTEEAYEFIPTLMKVLPDADAANLVEIGRSCSTKAIRRPWLEIVGSLPAPAAKAWVAQHRA